MFVMPDHKQISSLESGENSSTIIKYDWMELLREISFQRQIFPFDRVPLLKDDHEIKPSHTLTKPQPHKIGNISSTNKQWKKRLLVQMSQNGLEIALQATNQRCILVPTVTLSL